jgi:hypothetical protein
MVVNDAEKTWLRRRGAEGAEKMNVVCYYPFVLSVLCASAARKTFCRIS